MLTYACVQHSGLLCVLLDRIYRLNVRVFFFFLFLTGLVYDDSQPVRLQHSAVLHLSCLLLFFPQHYRVRCGRSSQADLLVFMYYCMAGGA